MKYYKDKKQDITPKFRFHDDEDPHIDMAPYITRELKTHNLASGFRRRGRSHEMLLLWAVLLSPL